MVLFTHLNKPCADLLNLNFVHDTPWQVEVKHGGFNPVLTHTASTLNTGLFAASTAFRYNGPWGFVDTKLSSNSVTANASFKTSTLPNVMLTSRVDRAFTNTKTLKDNFDLSVEFDAKDAAYEIKEKNSVSLLAPHCKLNVSPTLMRFTASGTAGIVFNRDTIARVGTEVAGLLDTREVKYSAGVSLTQTTENKIFNIALLASPFNQNVIGKLSAFIHCKENTPGSTELGAEVTHYPQTSKTTVALAGLWHLNPSIVGAKSNTILKVKLNQNAKAAFSVTHKLSNTISATVGTQIDTVKPEGVQYGLRLNVLA